MRMKHGISQIMVMTVLSMMLLISMAASVQALDDDFYIYSELNTGLSGSYGVDGYVGTDGVDRIIFYSGSTAYIYTVTIPEGDNPNTHPDNPDAPGPIAPRTFTSEKTFDLGVFPGHECEFYVDEENNIIYLGASVGIRKYVFDAMLDNYVYDSQVAPAAPVGEGYGTQTLAYDTATDTWYAGSIAWNYDPGVTLRDMWKYDGSQGSSGIWELAFQYTTPEDTGGSHHDGLEFISGHLWFADYTGEYIKQYNPDGSLVDVFWHEPLTHELEGMGYGALGHMWCGSHGSTISEFGGGRLQKAIAIPVYVDIKPGSWPNPLNLKDKGVLPVAVCGTEDFDIMTIDPETIQLSLEGLGVGVAPLRWSYEDVATPYIGEDCGGHDLDGDGYLDLTLKFKAQEVIQTLGLDAFSDRDVVVIVLTGNLKEEFDGTAILGQDCVIILKK